MPLAETFGYSTDLREHDAGPGHVHHGVRQVHAGAGSSIQVDVIAERKAELQPA